MKISLDDTKDLASHKIDSFRDIDKYASVMKDVNRMDEIKKAASLYSPMQEEMQRIAEMQKICEAPDYMKSAMDKMNLAANLGLSTFAMADVKRMNEIKEMFAPPAGISSLVQQELERHENMDKLMNYYPIPEHQPVVDIPVIRPLSDPMRETNKNLKETKDLQAKMAEHLEELVSQAKGTTAQNVKMIKLSTASLICTILGILVGIMGYYAGVNSSAPVPAPPPIVKTVPKSK